MNIKYTSRYRTSLNSRLRDLPEERLRTILHQLRQREAATDFHRADAESRAGRTDIFYGSKFKRLLFGDRAIK